MKILILENLKTPEWVDDLMDMLDATFNLQLNITYISKNYYEVSEGFIELNLFYKWDDIDAELGLGEFTFDNNEIVTEFTNYPPFKVFLYDDAIYMFYNTHIIYTSYKQFKKLIR